MEDFISRVNRIARNTCRPDLGFDVKDIPQLKQAIDEYRTAKEAELADVFDAESELADIEEAMVASFAGGSDGSGSESEGDDQ